MSLNAINKILIVRNDKLGDLMLAFPSFALIKSSLPNTEIVALVSEYTKDITSICEWVDRVIVDLPGNASTQDVFNFAGRIKNERFDAAITLFSTMRTGVILRLANIPYRLAPATKLAQIFYNHRLKQRRSLSEKPEHEYNTDLIRYFLAKHDIKAAEISHPLLTFDDAIIQTLRQQFLLEYEIDPRSIIIFLHPGSGGSATNLSIQQYSALAFHLTKDNNATIVVTAGPGEHAYASQLVKLLDNKSITNRLYESKHGIVNFAQHIDFADLFISGSTGPLHIAGALDVPTVGFYPKRRSATPLRWQTLNSPQRRLAFSPPADSDENDMSQIDIKSTAMEIQRQFALFITNPN